MTTPSPDDIHVALDALRADAMVWRTAANDVKRAARAAEGQVLPPASFTSRGLDLAAAYEALRAELARLTSEAAANFDTVADALDKSADTYEAEEQRNVHRLRGIY